MVYVWGSEYISEGSPSTCPQVLGMKLRSPGQHGKCLYPLPHLAGSPFPFLWNWALNLGLLSNILSP